MTEISEEEKQKIIEEAFKTLRVRLYGYVECIEQFMSIQHYEAERTGAEEVLEILKNQADDQAEKGEVSGELYKRIREYERKINVCDITIKNAWESVAKNTDLINGEAKRGGISVTPFSALVQSHSEMLMRCILEGKTITAEQLNPCPPS